jgi:hyperosmotically inducible periplasmic protein
MSARTICSIACFAALIAAGPALASEERQAATQDSAGSSDAAMISRIEDSLRKDSSLNKYTLKVVVDHGVATLTGAVRTDADRAKASQVATVPGVTRIDNQLVVDPSARIERRGTAGAIERKSRQGVERSKEGAGKVADKSKAGAEVVADKSKEGAEKTKDTAEKVYDKSKEGAEVVVDKTKQGVSRTGEAISDTYITTRGKTEFIGQDLLKDSDIKVDTNNHVVTLSGTVMSKAGREKAIALAKTVDGVQTVVNHLTVGPKKK